MKELTKRKKIIGTIETVLAAAVIIIAVVTAPKLSAQNEETSAAASETAAATQAVTETEQEKTEPTTSSVGIGVQPIGEYSLNGYIVVTGDAAMEMYSIASTKLKEYAASANNLASKIPSSKVYVMLAPTRMEFYGPEEYRTGSHSQQMGISTAYLALNPEVTGVDAYSEIARHTDEYEYFRTDHHWTALGAYYAYVQFCNVKGITPHDLSDYEVSQYTGFLGSFYNDGGKPQAMADDPDTVNAYHPVSSTAAMKYGSSEDSELTGGKVIFDESTAAASLKYGAFIMGDNPFTVIENPEVSNGQSCIVVKESFGNAFVPFLVDHYQTVYVVDYRYYGGSVSALAKAKGVTDVLFVNNLSAIRGSYQMGKLAGVK